MDTVIVLDGTDMYTALLGLFFFALGTFSKGVLFAVLAEVIYKPTARWIIKRGKVWEKENPTRLKWAMHFIEGHAGLRPRVCEVGKCSH